MKKTLLVWMCFAAMMVAGTGLKAQQITVTLSPGWTWFSYPCAETLDFSTAFGTFMPMEGDCIKSQYGFSEYHSGQWTGSISQFCEGMGYMYHSMRNEAVTFAFGKLVPQVLVTTSEPTDITVTNAMVGGTVTIGEGNHIFARGVCWGMESNPDIDGNHLTGNAVAGSQSFTLNDLTIGTTYYVRAYVATDNGLAYGEEKMFSTKDGIPVLTTAEITGIGMDQATCGGEVIDDGGLEITARGVCWSTSPNPTVADAHTTDGPGMGSFVSTMTGLTPNTTYYVRAYATNSHTTAYGDEVSFTTVPLSFMVTVSANPTMWGSVSGGGVYPDGQSCTLTALPNFGYTFTNWTENGNVVSSDASYTFTVNADRNLDANFAPATTVIGMFSVSATQKVNFAQGNLQYQASTDIWRFAEHQWDFVGNATSGTVYEGETKSNNALVAQDYTGWIDLFCWGTSGNEHGANCYQPWSISKNNADYWAYGNSDNDLNSQTPMTADWGFNAISNGGNQTELWRTLTQSEWYYLLVSRSTRSGIRFAKGCIEISSGNYVYGLIVLPDNWNPSIYTLNNTNNTSAGYDNVTISAEDWTSVLEANGAVFLPSAGYRHGNRVNSVLEEGIYWTATHGNSYSAYDLIISSGSIAYNNIDYFGRYAGLTVRLVHEALDNGIPVLTTSSVSDYGTTWLSCGGEVTDGGGLEVTERGICWSTSPNPTIEGNHIANGAGLGSFSVSITGLTPGTTYYVRAYATNSYTTAYGNELLCQTRPFEGGVAGLFSVSDSQQVYFSQGNLQYNAEGHDISPVTGDVVGGTWRFAEKQWDYIGKANSNVSSTYNGWIDLFVWGTSGYNHGAVCYQPWSTSTNWNDYLAYGSYSYHLYDQSGKADWGYNAISNGGNQENLWRTLTVQEWDYLLSSRVTPSNIRFAAAKVNGVNGVILLPDNWNESTFSLNQTNYINTSYYYSNVLTISQWSILEQAGAVFLPVGGRRNGTALEYNYENTRSGAYWTATSGGSYGAAALMGFSDVTIATGYWSRKYGNYVRLVRNAQ